MLYRFRAYDSVGKKMYYPDEIGLNPNIYFGSEDDGTLRIFLVVDQYEHRELVLMLSVGISDKNGKEIFGGDIDSTVFVFTYNVGMGSWYRMKNGEGFQWHCQAIIKGRLPFGVIGNIYENPELLKENK